MLQLPESDDFTRLRKFAHEIQSDFHLPIVVAMTKPDEVCPEVLQSVMQLSMHPTILNYRKELAQHFNIDTECVFPVLNYFEPSRSKSLLLEQFALRALHKLLQLFEASALFHAD